MKNHFSNKDWQAQVLRLTALGGLLLTNSLSLVSYALPQSGGAKVSTSHKKIHRISVGRYTQLGDQLLAAGRNADAEELYHSALNINSKDIYARVGYGLALCRQLKLGRAEEELNLALKQDPHNALARCGKAQVILQRLRSSSTSIAKNKTILLNQALNECNQAYAIDPSLPETMNTIGLIYLEQGSIADAETAFDKALKLDPSYSDALAGLGQVRLQQGKIADAVKFFRRAINENKGNYLAHFGLGQAYLKQGLTDQAIAELNTALYQNHNSARIHVALGLAYQSQGNRVAAIKEFQEAIRIKPETKAAYLGIAGIYEERGDLEQAIAELHSGMEISPFNNELRLRIADDLLKSDRLDDAIKEYELALALTPKNTAAAVGLTRAYYLKCQKETSSAYISDNGYQRAEQLIANAVKLNPNNLELHLAQAKLQLLAGKPYDSAQVIKPTNDPERIAYAEMLLAANKFSDSLAQMRAIISSMTNGKDLLALADMSLLLKDLDSAEMAYNKARLIPDSEERAGRGLDAVLKERELSRKQLTFANDLAFKQQLASAIDKYNAALAANPRNYKARLGLAQALERFYPGSAKGLNEAANQYSIYMALAPELSAKEAQKLQKHLAKLVSRTSKLDAKQIAVKHK